MSELTEYIALQVNGEEVSLYEALRPAKVRGDLQIVREAIDSAIIRQAAEDRAIEVSGEELQQAADDFRSAHDLTDAEATEGWLAARHLTFEDWELVIEDSLLKQKLCESVTTGKVEQHFAENRLSFDTAELSRLVISDEGVARELRAQITEDGADFHALARKYSTDVVTRPAGGYAGVLKRIDMEAVVESSVFGAQSGKVVGPFKLDDGWHLIKIEALYPATLDDNLREKIKAQLFDEWLSEQRRKAKIRVPLLETEPELQEEAEDVEPVSEQND
jgi:putative peptide maturation system protein